MKKFRNVVLTALIIILAVICAIIFLTTKEPRLSSPVFWIGWAFAVPVNLIMAICFHIWAGSKNSEDIVQLPVIYYLIAIFGSIFLVAGLLFVYLPIDNVVAPIVIFGIITLVYIGFVLYFTFAANYISGSRKETKQKVAYIRLLKADVDDCIMKTQNANVKDALEKFSANIRFSDPMSSPALAGIEEELSKTVIAISTIIESASEEEIIQLINKGQAQLDSRNRRCLALK